MRTPCTYYEKGIIENGFILGFVSLPPLYCSGFVPHAVIETTGHDMISRTVCDVSPAAQHLTG